MARSTPFLRRRRTSGTGSPRLSVVLPVYRVERYIGACLESIRRQTLSDYEVIVVDDGSPDGSMGIVERFARDDPRLRVVSQVNSGLGAARNAGVRHARARLLTFVDSDDALPVIAWERLLSVLETTGSDFAVGKIERDDGHRRWAGPLMAANHSTNRLRATLEEMPLALADVFATNKVFRRDFWERERIRFPEDVRYEDQPTMTKAFLGADRFDFIADTVYWWCLRSEGASITQRRSEFSDLVDRRDTKRSSAQLVRARNSAAVAEVFFAAVLPVDMWEYFRASVGADEGYWSYLVDFVREFWGEHTLPFEGTRVPPQQRLMGWLVANDRRADLARWLETLDVSGPEYEGDVLVHPWSQEITILRN